MAVQSKLSPWGRAAAGASAAVLANAIVYPLDTVKTRLQVQVKQDTEATEKDDPFYTSTWDALRTIYQEEGLRGLYAGFHGSLLGVASTNFAYFYWYSFIRTLYFKSRKTSQPTSTATELMLGAVAGAIAQIFTIPVSVVTTRQQNQRPGERKGLRATTKEIVHEQDGVFGLWRGLKASLVLVVNPAITYGAYERFNQILFADRKALRAWESFCLGAISKSIATIMTQPLIVAKVGLQSKPPAARKGKPFHSFVEVMQFIMEREGILSLFKGIGPQITKGLLVQGILMTIKDRMELLVILLFRWIKRQGKRI